MLCEFICNIISKERLSKLRPMRSSLRQRTCQVGLVLVFASACFLVYYYRGPLERSILNARNSQQLINTNAQKLQLHYQQKRLQQDNELQKEKEALLVQNKQLREEVDLLRKHNQQLHELQNQSRKLEQTNQGLISEQKQQQQQQQQQHLKLQSVSKSTTNTTTINSTTISLFNNQKLHPDVKVVPSIPEPQVQLPRVDCVPLPKSPKNGVKICLHSVHDDMHVSGTIKRGGVWEFQLVKQMEELLKKDPSLQVVDLGCNIGEYTLWAAALDRPVLAVEMLQSNINLVQKSLQLSQLSSNVTLVQNAVYSDHRQLKTLFLKNNLGGTRLNTSSHNDPIGRPVDSNRAAIILNTVTLDDLISLVDPKRPIYMKIDVENSEHHVLEGAHKFFQERNVQFVQIEWLGRTHEEIVGIRTFMQKYGFVARKNIHTNAPVDLNVATIMGDIIFMKKAKS